MPTFTYPAVLDADTALSLLERAVATKGFDYSMDSGCYYVLDGEPRCLVGVALSLAGVDVVEVLGNGDDTNSCRIGAQYGSEQGRVVNALRTAGLVLDKDALSVFTTAQDAQDRNKTWGQALVAAYKARVEQLRYNEPPF